MHIAHTHTQALHPTAQCSIANRMRVQYSVTHLIWIYWRYIQPHDNAIRTNKPEPSTQPHQNKIERPKEHKEHCVIVMKE